MMTACRVFGRSSNQHTENEWLKVLKGSKKGTKLGHLEIYIGCNTRYGSRRTVTCGQGNEKNVLIEDMNHGRCEGSRKGRNSKSKWMIPYLGKV